MCAENIKCYFCNEYDGEYLITVFDSDKNAHVTVSVCQKCGNKIMELNYDK